MLKWLGVPISRCLLVACGSNGEWRVLELFTQLLCRFKGVLHTPDEFLEHGGRGTLSCPGHSFLAASGTKRSMATHATRVGFHLIQCQSFGASKLSEGPRKLL